MFFAPVTATQYAACPKPAVAVAPHEPYVTRGPTEIVVGLYVQGGAFDPNCRRQPPRGPYGGTVVVRGASGAVVARETLRVSGKLFVIHVAPGRYTISTQRGGFVEPESVTVRAGYTVRRDLFEDVP
jgi:hypothetical protein